MKKFILVISLFILSITSVNALELPVEVTADSVILYNQDSDQIVYEKDPDTLYSIASLTKMMTAHTVINNIPNLDKKVTITDKDFENLLYYTKAGLEVGDVVTYRDLLYAMMLPSGAEASLALANNTSGNEKEFTKLMNSESKKLGLRNSTFVDSYGGSDDNKSTARELLRFTKEALKNKDFEKVFKTTTKTLSNGLSVTNYTRSIATYHGLDSEIITGSKSGFTDAAGLCLLSTVKINNTNYILIVLHSDKNEYLTTHVLDTYKVVNHLTTQEFETRTIIKKGTKIKRIPVQDSTISEYIVYVEEDIKVTLPIEEFNNIQIEYNITDTILNTYTRGDNLGYIDIKLNDKVLTTYNIYLKDHLYTIAELPRNIIIIILSLIILVFIIFILNLFTKKKKK